MLELYIIETCPYCKKVMNYLDEHKISYLKFDVTNQKNYDRLMDLGGLDQVPFLYDSEKNITLYNSDDILRYLESI